MIRAFYIVLFLLYLGCGETNPIEGYKHIDILISDGLIYDGISDEPFEGHIFIIGDSIVYSGMRKWNHPDIRKVIDAQGKCIAPGFIDLHAHGNPLATPDFKNFLSMGVTTIVLGQDGSSPAVNPLKGWLNKVDSLGIGVNLAMMVGHGTLRKFSGINNSPNPDRSDLDLMKTLLDDHLEYTFGLSTGLEYTPGLYAPESELIELAEVVGNNDRIIMSHMRNEDDDQLQESIEELLRQGDHARVHIAHLKSVYGKGKGRAEEILYFIHEGRNRGIDVSADMYPYIASYTGISILFPEWAKSNEQLREALPSRRLELENFLKDKVNKRNGPMATLLGSEPYTGKTLADLESEMNLPFEKILIDVIGPEGSSGAYFIMDEELQSRMLKDPIVGVCSDGSPTGHHPRGHGTFAKVIETYVKEYQLLELSEAISKMTSYAASILNIEDRGSITKGKKADLIIFDPEQVRAPADYPNPHLLSEGFNDIIINGKIVRENGHFTGELFGQVLYPKS